VSDGGHVWWEDAVVYEVYPRSFADADGDGVGDLPGLRSRLGYLADLGVDAIWLTPFYPSPLADGGYDVSDYCAVDPLLGTIADFDARQIRVIIDLVPNHCSSAHPLFRAALAAAPGSDERARFIFRDGPENEQGTGGDQPPNNWPSQFGSSARTKAGCSASPGSPGSSSPPTSARRRCRCPPTAMCCSPAGPWPAAACRPIPPSGSARDAGRLSPAFSLYPANRTILGVMPKVKVPRKNVTPGEIVTVLSRRLGPGYQVESNGSRRVMVRKSPLMYASISISDQPGASVFGVHGGGFLFLRLVNTFGTARRVADALRRSPEFRSL